MPTDYDCAMTGGGYRRALRSPGSPSLVEVLFDILKRLDCARCERGESNDCCVIDLLVELAQQPCWSTLETVRLTTCLSSLRTFSSCSRPPARVHLSTVWV